MKYQTICLATAFFTFSVTPLLAAKPSGPPGQVDARDGSPRPTRSLTISPRPTNSRPSDAGRKITGTPGAAGKLQACEARQVAIKARSQNLADFTTRVIATFDKIATRVREFYTAKGITVANYAALNADVTAKKTAAQNALVRSQATILNFSCTSGDPKATLKSFNDNMKKVKSALKDYRTSIKNLIVAVHSQAPADNGAEDQQIKPTRKPTDVRPTKKGGRQ